MQDTRAYLRDLQRLTADKSIDNKDELLRRVTDLFFATADEQSSGDVSVFGSVMERIAYEVEIEARARLAERFSEAEHAPRRLVRRLAEDDIEVARPILEKSPHLTDDDLVDIARSKGQEHLLAISGRDSLSPPITDVIVERGEPHVVSRVAANKGAKFSESGFKQLSRQAAEHGEVMQALTTRRDIPSNMLGEIKEAVTERMKVELARSNPELDPAEVERMVAEKTASIDLAAFQASNDRLARMKDAGRITERMLSDFARARRLPETVRCLSLLTGLNDKLVSHCLLKAHLCALGILCKANGFDNSTYAALIQIRSASDRLRGTAIAAAMRGYNSLPKATAERMLGIVCEQAAGIRQPASERNLL